MTLALSNSGWGGILPARIHHPPGFMEFSLQPVLQRQFTALWQHLPKTGQKRFSTDAGSTFLVHGIFRDAANGRMIRIIRHALPCPASATAARGAA